MTHGARALAVPLTVAENSLSTPVSTWRMLMEFWTAAAHDAELREHAAELARRYREPFGEAVRRGVESGTFRPRYAAPAIVDVAVAAMDGLLYPVVLDHQESSEKDYRDVVVAQLGFALGAGE